MTPKQLLINARHHLVENGWIQGYNYDENSEKCCSFGALYVALWRSDDRANRGALTGAMIELSKAIGNYPVTWWNDQPERTKEDVIAAFDRAIEACK